jgi:hypothetical protein
MRLLAIISHMFVSWIQKMAWGVDSNPRVLSDMGLAIANKEAFQNYLKVQKISNFKQILCYAQKYTDVLLTGDASILMSLPSAQ